MFLENDANNTVEFKHSDYAIFKKKIEPETDSVWHFFA